jgi:hypothetical protein
MLVRTLGATLGEHVQPVRGGALLGDRLAEAVAGSIHRGRERAQLLVGERLEQWDLAQHREALVDLATEAARQHVVGEIGVGERGRDAELDPLAAQRREDPRADPRAGGLLLREIEARVADDVATEGVAVVLRRHVEAVRGGRWIVGDVIDRGDLERVVDGADHAVRCIAKVDVEHDADPLRDLLAIAPPEDRDAVREQLRVGDDHRGAVAELDHGMSPAPPRARDRTSTGSWDRARPSRPP